MKTIKDLINGIKRSKCEIYSRVVGYLRPVDGWNKGKKSEFEDRKEYVLSNEKGC